VKETQRPAVTGDRCTCGRLAVIVFVTDVWGEVAWCGRSDGGGRGSCVFCGATTGHSEGRCPGYRLRPDDEQAQRPYRHVDPAREAGAQ
jgi:hypothetical protein